MRTKIIIPLILLIISFYPIFAWGSPLKLNAIPDQVVDEGKTLTFTVSATGGTGSYTYSYSPLLSGATLNSSSGVFSWIPTYSQSGVYNETFTVKDFANATASKSCTITVNNVNRAPVLDPIGNKSVDEGATLQFTVSATDPDGDTLTYSFSATPSLPGATINSSTGAFSWTPGYDQQGSHSVRFTVTDNGSPSMSDFEDITITVNNVICNSPDVPAIDFTGNWAFSPTTKTLTLSDMKITVSVISPTESYIENDPVKEEIIDAAVNVPVLNRDLVNPYLFGDSTLSITELGNTYLSSDLINIEFTEFHYDQGRLQRIVMNACYDSDNLRNVDTSSNGNASRFIDTLIKVGYGPDYPNLRLTLNVLDGTADFDTYSSSGSCEGKIESASGPTLIDLALFEAIPDNREVAVVWITASEIDNVGFNLYRSESEVGGYVQLNSSIILAEGMATAGATYQYVDENVKNRKTYYYTLEDIDLYGTSTFHGPTSVTPRLIYSIRKK